MKGPRKKDILTNMSTNIKLKTNNIKHILIEKIEYIQEIIRNTILSIKRNKNEGIFSNNDSILSISILIELYEKTDGMYNSLSSSDESNNDDIIDGLQQVINKLSVIICGFGTSQIDDLLFISFGSEFKNTIAPNNILQTKYDLIKKYVRPIGYKIIHWNKNKTTHLHKNILCDNKITEEDVNIENKVSRELVEKFSNSIGQKFVARDYQVDAILHSLKFNRALLLSPTASGKSFIIYSLIRYYTHLIKDDNNNRILLIVPTTSLVEQMYSDFKEYGWNVEKYCHRLYSGYSNVTDKKVLISTWQSLFRLPKAYFDQFGVVFGDEAHLFKSKSLSLYGISAVTAGGFAVGQIIGPTMVGWIADGPGGLQRGLLFSAGALLLGAVLAWQQKPIQKN